MNFFQRAKALVSKTAFDQYLNDFLSGNDITIQNGKPVTSNTALTYSAFFGCARVLAETFASVGINEYKKLENGDRDILIDVLSKMVFSGKIKRENVTTITPNGIGMTSKFFLP